MREVICQICHNSPIRGGKVPPAEEEMKKEEINENLPSRSAKLRYIIKKDDFYIHHMLRIYSPQHKYFTTFLEYCNKTIH